MNTVLVKEQKKSFVKVYTRLGVKYRITAVVRYDDQCGNGHNSFSITGTIERQSKNGRWVDECGGCIHDEISKLFPQLRPLIKYHLVSSDGPMHYIANSLYWGGYNQKWCDGKAGSPPNYDYFRKTALWPSITNETIQSTSAVDMERMLLERLPLVLREFKAAVESLGFVY